MPFRIEGNKFPGDTVYGRKVINSIIALATQEISGVAGLHGKGFRTEINGQNVVVDVYIKVFPGISCSEVAFRVQENIKHNVESMTAYKIDVINVNILSVSLNEKQEKVAK